MYATASAVRLTTRFAARHGILRTTPAVVAVFQVRGMAAAAAAAVSSNAAAQEETPDFVRTAIQRMMLEQAQTAGAASSEASSSTLANNSSHNSNISSSSSNGMNSSSNLQAMQTAQQEALESVQHQLEEVRLCIADCAEAADAEHFLEEFQNANAALEQAVLVFTDWLEDARQNDNTNGGGGNKELRETCCLQIKLLRSQLDALKAD